MLAIPVIPSPRLVRCTLALITGLAAPAAAHDTTRLLAQVNDWTATEHVRPDGRIACLLIDPSAVVGLRADGDGTRLEVGNRHWDLPASLHGTIALAFGTDTRTLPITANTNQVVAASLDSAALQSLQARMAQAREMRITVGQTTKLHLDLTGIGPVLRAFRACAGTG